MSFGVCGMNYLNQDLTVTTSGIVAMVVANVVSRGFRFRVILNNSYLGDPFRSFDHVSGIHRLS